MIEFSVNGKMHRYDGDMEKPLLWYLRGDVKLIGTKFGCGIASCGACTVHIDGSSARSCSLTMNDLAGKRVTTIEGMEQDGRLHAVQQAWIDEDVAQCGFCQAGQIMATASFLKDYPKPTDADINENLDNLCRCNSYSRMRKAIFRAADSLNKPNNLNKEGA